MEGFTIVNNEVLQALCIKHDWFCEGSNSQFDKLFYMNSYGEPIEHIALVIWLCSDANKWSRKDILEILKAENKKYGWGDER